MRPARLIAATALTSPTTTATDRDIRRVFLIEAGTLGLLGGTIGAAIGLATACLEHPDLASPFPDRGEHRVRDAERRDGKRDDADTGKDELDDV
jgi:hypothetical protein